jgi:hypothetical protein
MGRGKKIPGLVLETIQYFVSQPQIASIHCGEQTLNPRESAIRSPFVPRLFHEPANDVENRRFSPPPLPFSAPMGICCLPEALPADVETTGM